MPASEKSSPSAMERELVLTRIFDAPRELVFECWTQREHLQRWWGPHLFTNPVCEVDPRPGGAIRIVMRGPNGMEHVTHGVFEEIVPPERLSFTNNAEDATGRLLLEGFTTVTFEDHNGKTRLTLRTRARGLVEFAPQMLAGMEMGWSQSLERLAEELARR